MVRNGSGSVREAEFGRRGVNDLKYIPSEKVKRIFETAEKQHAAAEVYPEEFQKMVEEMENRIFDELLGACGCEPVTSEIDEATVMQAISKAFKDIPIGSPVYEIMKAPWMVEKSQRKKHRKKRINKKWKKRYGEKEVPAAYAYMSGSTIICHPIYAEKIKKECAGSAEFIEYNPLREIKVTFSLEREREHLGFMQRTNSVCGIHEIKLEDDKDVGNSL